MKWNFSLFFIAIFLYSPVFSIDEDLDDEISVEDVYEDGSEDDIKYVSPKISPDLHYFAEHFDDPQAFEKKWVRSQATKDGVESDIAKYDGVWNVEAPQREKLKNDYGLVLKSKAKHAAISAPLQEPFEFKNDPFVIQYEVTLQEGQECGGAYLKLLTYGLGTKNLKEFNDKTPYTIMFGPDKCGNDHKLHFIFRHENPKNKSVSEKHCKKPKDRLEEMFTDKLPHLYTLILFPDNTFKIQVDHKVVNEGNLLEDFTPPVNPPAEIDDPNDIKPNDWDERETIPDPDARKPDDWDENAPKTIPDPSAVKPNDWLDNEERLIPNPDAEKPDDWDTEMDGDWEAPLIQNPVCETVSGCGKWEPPQINNPAYKGKWRAPLINNPNYKGKWKPRRIPNPDYFVDDKPFEMAPIGAVGFEIWSMTNNILFDNLIITDDPKVARDWATKTFDLKRRKIDKDAQTLWEKILKLTNNKPGLWALYIVYCLIPVGVYIWYLRKRYVEESMWTRFIRYTHDNPWVWAVVVLAVGLPLVLIIFFCCTSSNSKDDKSEDPATVKKTDAVTPDTIEEVDGKDAENEEEDAAEDELAEGDTEKSPKAATSKSSLEELNVSDSGQMEEGTEASGDAPRRRKVRKD